MAVLWYHEDMLEGPIIPSISSSDLLAVWGGLPLRIELSPMVLAALLLPVGIFIAALSVMLIYHWRRFPFEHALFRWVERVYLLGVFVLLTIATLGIVLSS
jgi:hypothetical protein